MSLHHAGRMPCVLGVLLLSAFSGCHVTTPGNTLFSRSNSAPPPAKTAPGTEKTPGKAVQATLVQPHTELTWEFQTSQELPGQVRSGRGVVGPDGELVLGPYGTCRVAGQTLEQARASVEKHLGAWVKTPTVRLSATLPQTAVATAGESPWRSAANGVSVVGGSRTGNSIYSPTFQTNKEPGPLLPGKDNGPMLPPKEEGLPTLPMPKTMPETSNGSSSSTPGQTLVGPLPAHGLPPHGLAPHGGAPAPSELNRVTLPPYVIGVTDVLQIDSLIKLRTQPVTGPHLVRPDGTVSVGIYGDALVAGMTLTQAKDAIARVIFTRMDQYNRERKEKKTNDKARDKTTDKGTDKATDKGTDKATDDDSSPELTLRDVVDNLNVDILAYNSKVYYVITDGGGYGEQVYPFPLTGNETVLDGLGKINGLPWNASKKHIWVARRVPGHGEKQQILPVDWIAITQHGATATNYQIMPGDRVYVKADGWRRADAVLAKILSPFERIFGITLLGSQTVNSIRSGTVGGGR